MKFSFRKLPLTYKLLLTGIIPLLALLYVSVQLYLEKENRVSIVSVYNNHFHESGEMASLMGELETEAEYSLSFALNKGRYSTLVLQRSRTDKWIHELEKSGDTSITGFLKYTFRNGLASTRASQDDGTAVIDVNTIMDFYHTAIWQLNNIHTITPSNSDMLQPLNAAVQSGGLLFEMETLLAMTRNKIYLSLLTAHDTPAIVSMAGDALHTLKTNEAAFLVKAPPTLVKMYNEKANSDALLPVFNYLDYATIHHQFDSTYTALQWWTTATGGMKVLHRQYLVSRQQLQAGLSVIYESEIKARNMTLLLLAAVILLVTIFFIYIIIAVNRVLKKRIVASANASPGHEAIDAHTPLKDNVSDLILDAIYRAGKTNGATAGDAANGVNGHAAPVVKPGADKEAVPGTNGKITINKQETGSKMNGTPYFPLELHTLPENPGRAVNDDLANYVIPKLTSVPVNSGAGSKGEVELKAQQRADSLTSQMNELLEAAAIESGRFIYHKHIFKLNELVSEMVNETGNAIPSYKISLRKNAGLSVYGDRARIAQVLSNLLQNAIDHCPGSNSIIVNLEEKDQMAICSVEDFGNGVAIDQQGKIFEKFYRVNSTNGVSHPGLGLGLYIAIEIIKQHHGKMWMLSEPGLGSTFYFSLPVSTTSQ